MLYTIWRIDNSRNNYVDQIQTHFNQPPIQVRCINGRNDSLRRSELDRLNLHSLLENEPALKPGELGVWLTFVNTLRVVSSLNENLLVFEDDSIIHHNFWGEFQPRLDELPTDFDFFSLFIPRDHDNWYKYKPELDKNGMIVNGMAGEANEHQHRVNNLICRPWQRYGGVSMLWSPQGARKALSLIYDRPYKQWDEYIYAQSRLGKLNGYTSHPNLPDLVKISGSETSLVR